MSKPAHAKLTLMAIHKEYGAGAVAALRTYCENRGLLWNVRLRFKRGLVEKLIAEDAIARLEGHALLFFDDHVFNHMTSTHSRGAGKTERLKQLAVGHLQGVAFYPNKVGK